MKMMMKLFAIVALLAMTASCVTTKAPVALPEKYNLNNELKEVRSITAQNIANWEQVDKQALIFTANGNDVFLAILDRPLETDIAKQVIGIVNQSTTISAGIDKFFIRAAKGRQYYVMEKIYVLNGREQAKEIKDRLSK
jgi:hypothetical protein